MEFLTRLSTISRLQHIQNEGIIRRINRSYTTETKQLMWYGYVMRVTRDEWSTWVMEFVQETK